MMPNDGMARFAALLGQGPDGGGLMQMLQAMRARQQGMNPQAGMAPQAPGGGMDMAGLMAQRLQQMRQQGPKPMPTGTPDPVQTTPGFNPHGGGMPGGLGAALQAMAARRAAGMGGAPMGGMGGGGMAGGGGMPPAGPQGPKMPSMPSNPQGPAGFASLAGMKQRNVI